MRRALHLAGRRTLVRDLDAVGAVIDVVLVLAPDGIHRGEALLGLLLRLAAEFGAQLQRAHLAVIDAEAAGHALVAVDLGDVVRPQHIRGVEVLAQTQRQAGAAAAVADSGRPIVALGGVYLVYEAVEYFQRLLFADQPVAALLGEKLGVVVYVHAHVVLEVAAALTHEAAGPST